MHYGHGLPKKPSKRPLGKGCISIPGILCSATEFFKIKFQLKIQFSIGKSSSKEYQITLAWGRDVDPIRSPEDDLLDATREAMQNGDDWSVGCSTVRKNA